MDNGSIWSGWSILETKIFGKDGKFNKIKIHHVFF